MLFPLPLRIAAMEWQIENAKNISGIPFLVSDLRKFSDPWSGAHDKWPPQTDREHTDREQTDREQRQLAEKGDSKYILLSPEPSCPTLTLWRNHCEEISDQIAVTKPLVRGQLVAVSWLCSLKRGDSTITINVTLLNTSLF